MRDTIFLIGYRATGKTSVGQALATAMGLSFIDMDQELVARQGQSIAEMVAAQGWPYFRALEKELLTELTGRHGLVVSTGGGAILHQAVWPAVMASGLVVWLSADQETIRQRLQADRLTASQRPALTAASTEAEIRAVLAEREPLYRAAAHLAVESNRPVNEVAGEIEAILQEGS